MKKLTLSEWEEKYIVRPVERFDQKYTMFSRPGWDPEIKGLLKSWSTAGEVKQKSGYTLQDQALRWASRQGTQLDLLNTSKPNLSLASRVITKALTTAGYDIGYTGLEAPMISGAFIPQEGVKIDVSDLQTVTRDVKKAATYFGADLVGICRLDMRWVYSHVYKGAERSSGDTAMLTAESEIQEIPEEFQYAVVMGFEEEYDMIQYAPTYIADAAASMGYSRMSFANTCLSAFIRYLGFQAIDCSTNDVAVSIPLAVQAGLGDLGRNGLLITPQFGPRLRVSKVITDLPLVADVPIDFGVTEFCAVCGKCAHMCPARAILLGERTAERNDVSNIAGVLKWPIDAEKCRTYWARINKPCTICIACCPYNKPDTWFHRIVRRFADNVRWADSFYVKMDDLLGYGKPKKAERFWEEWKPRRH